MTPTDYSTPTSRPFAREFYIATFTVWHSDYMSPCDSDYMIYSNIDDARAKCEEWDRELVDACNGERQWCVSLVTQTIPMHRIDDDAWSWWDIAFDMDSVWETIGEFVPTA